MANYFPRFGLSALDEPIDYSMQRPYFQERIPAPAPSVSTDYGKIASLLERDNNMLRQELKNARDKAAESLKDLTHSREETRTFHERCEELQREVQRARDTAGRADSLKVAECQAELALLRQEIRTRDHQIAAQADQRAAEAERARSQQEHADQMRREIEDLRSKLQSAMDKGDALFNQVC
jgi:hypothetical protein